MISGMKTHRLNKEFGSKFPEDYRDQHAPDEGRRARRPKRCHNNRPNVNNSYIHLVPFKLFTLNRKCNYFHLLFIMDKI